MMLTVLLGRVTLRTAMTDGESKQPTDSDRGDATKPTDDDTSNPKSESTVPPKEGSEDQMAEWEEALKNDDWGHQPC